MKPTITAALALVLAAGCSAPHLLEPGELVTVRTGGNKAKLSAQGFDRIARQYVDEHRLEFDFQESTHTVWVKPRDDCALAHVYYYRGLGNQCLRVGISREGRAIDHNIGNAVCGSGRPYQ